VVRLVTANKQSTVSLRPWVRGLCVLCLGSGWLAGWLAKLVLISDLGLGGKNSMELGYIWLSLVFLVRAQRTTNVPTAVRRKKKKKKCTCT
jgi:hypothetical protein